MTLYAVWKPISYWIIYDNNGGAGNREQLVYYDVTVKLEALDAVFVGDGNQFVYKPGYKGVKWQTLPGSFTVKQGTSFAGQTYSFNQQVINLCETTGATFTLYIVWEVAPITIRYTNFSTNPMPTYGTQTFYYEDGVKLIPPSPATRQGYYVASWTKEQGTFVEGKGTVYSNPCYRGYFLTFLLTIR